MPRLFAPDDREGRLVIDHHHRLEIDGRVFDRGSDERVHIAETDIISAGRDARDRFARAIARVQRDSPAPRP